jgi:hypothetical protein
LLALSHQKGMLDGFLRLDGEIIEVHRFMF